MRVVRMNPSSFLDRSRPNEAKKAFGNGDVYMKSTSKAGHIEFQMSPL